MSALDQVHLENDYMLGAVKRSIAFQQRAQRYELEFERAYTRRMERRAEERKQFLDVILPKIKEEAAMRRYERGLAARNSGAFPEPGRA